jgi:uncharacterized protein YlxW (UPF0749 family)
VLPAVVELGVAVVFAASAVLVAVTHAVLQYARYERRVQWIDGDEEELTEDAAKRVSELKNERKLYENEAFKTRIAGYNSLADAHDRSARQCTAEIERICKRGSL